MIEAKKLAYADLAKYIGDPKGTEIAGCDATFEGVGRAKGKLIDADKANCDAAAGR